ncbi:MAG: hemolysin family protein [Desulfobacterota bacterium]|nr:hemolysin family protein [Thermodesulfobacteriota bacterium]
MLPKIFLAIFFIVLNAFFIAVDISLVKLDMFRRTIHGGRKYRCAAVFERIADRFDAYRAAAHVGISVGCLGLGWIGTTLLVDLVRALMHHLGLHLSSAAAPFIAFPVAFFTILGLHLAVCVRAPSIIAWCYPEQTARCATSVLGLLYAVTRPLIRLVDGLATVLVRFAGRTSPTRQELYALEVMRLLLQQGRRPASLTPPEQELIAHVFAFSGRSVKQIMVPRTQMVALEITTPGDHLIDFFIDEGFSRIPVYQGTIDNIIGIVYAKDIITLMDNPHLIILQDLIRPAQFVSETMPIHELLREMQHRHTHMAIVVDEFGGTAGLVTLEDIIEELVGEIQDEYDDEQPLVERLCDNTYLVRGSAALSDVNELLPRPLPKSWQYETVAGLMNYLFGRIPEVNETVLFAGYECTIVQTKKRTVTLVRLREVSNTENVQRSA